MSQFDDELKSIVAKVGGAQAAILIGFDGIPISEINEASPNLAVQDIAVEYGRILMEAMKIAQANHLGAISELNFATDSHRILLRVLDSTYFVCLVLAPDGNIGKGRYALSQALPVLKSLF
jgi:predicted regulator of Ras-like GTPase activity (Roadblock/LC7/MglB family)